MHFVWPRAITKRQSVLLLASAQLFSGCALVTDCAYEERFVIASAVVGEGVDTTGANITVTALRGSLESKSLDRSISGVIKGHVTSIFLVSSDAASPIRLAFPIDASASPFISSGTFTQHPGDSDPDLAGLFEVVAGNHGVVEISTDIPSQPLVSIPLIVSTKRDWFRPRNCY